MRVERFEKLQDDVARMGDQMNSADKMLHEIGSFWARVTSRFKSQEPNGAEHADRRTEWEEEHRAHMQAKKGTASPHSAPLDQALVFADDEDGDLDAIHAAVLEMRRKALMMGENIEDHNHRLDHLNTETVLTTERIRTSKTKVDTLIKKL